MSGKHFGEHRRRASGNNPVNPSSFVPYHHRRSIRPAKIADQGLRLRVRHVWKSWGGGAWERSCGNLVEGGYSRPLPRA